MSPSVNPGEREVPPAWREMIAPYQQPDLRRSVAQVANTFVPYLLLQALMLLSLHRSVWLTAALAVLTSGFLVRTFIIFHDCGHGSFFRSRLANEIVGFMAGVLTWAPSQKWWQDHATHHAASANLDRRGVGDIDMLTVDEFHALSPARKLWYRVFRHPLFLFGFGGAFVFLIEHRVWQRGASRRVRVSVIAANLALLSIGATVVGIFGWRAWLLTQLLPVYITTVAGFWLFYVQHQFEGVYWARDEAWSFFEASTHGSSYYKLPRLLQWFSGNIGFHHVHHLSSRIPNYRLEDCHDANPVLQQVKVLTLASATRSLTLRLYDEQSGRLVGWR